MARHSHGCDGAHHGAHANQHHYVCAVGEFSPTSCVSDHGHNHNHGHVHSHAPWRVLLQEAWLMPDSRKILLYMALNVVVIALQVFYGYVTNSLGLISDAVHMMFDCVALAAGLAATVAAHWPRNPRYPFGYARVEVLAAFGNAIALWVISASILVDSFERLITPRDVDAPKVLPIAIVGFAVNLIGIFFFHHHGPGTGGGGSPKSPKSPASCSAAHQRRDSHTHSGALQELLVVAAATSPTHAPQVDKKRCCSSSSGAAHDANMRAMFLHVLADALGSVAVVVSAGLIWMVGWSGFDPLASALIAVLIWMSTWPVVRWTYVVLVSGLPDEDASRAESAKRRVGALPGVVREKCHIWSHDGVTLMATARVWYADTRESDEARKDQIMAAMSEFGINRLLAVEICIDSQQAVKQ